MPQQPGNPYRAKKSSRPKSTTTQGAARASAIRREISLEEAIAALQKLGFQITAPVVDADRARQAATLDALGFERGAEPEAPRSTRTLRGYLHARHTLGTTVYGPGDFELPPWETALYQTLLQADQACVRGHMDTREYHPEVRSFMIVPGQGGDQFSKYSKVEVATGAFESTWQTTDNMIAVDLRTEH